MLRCLSVFFGAAFLLNPALAATDPAYPQAERGSQVDVYHGTSVADPYRWLEDVDSPQTQAWVKAQQNLFSLQALPLRQAFSQRLSALWNYERSGLPVRKGKVLFFEKNNGLQNQAVLYQQIDGQAPTLVLDPNLLSKDGTSALTEWKVSPNGKVLAYSVSEAGSDWNQIQFLSLDTLKPVSGRLSRVKFSSLAWVDDQTLLYSRYPETNSANRASGTFEKLANHQLVAYSLEQDRSEVLLANPDHPEWIHAAQVSDDRRYVAALIAPSASSDLAVWIKDLKTGSLTTAPWQKVVEKPDHEYVWLGSVGERQVFLTNHNAPRKKIVAYDKNGWHTLIKEGSSPIASAMLAGGEIIVQQPKDVVSQLLRFDLNGKFLRNIGLPPLVSIPENGLSGSRDDGRLYYGYAGYTQPFAIREIDLKKNEDRAFFTPKVAFKPEDYVTERVFYRSKDGTRIPLFISHKKGLKPSKKNPLPTLLYGYGGFDISLTPSFSVQNLVWMEAGGAYVVANLRGGGEYGSRWHEAGRRLNKQNVFDDFAWAAKYLIQTGWTSPQRLGIYGRSNGGLLVGAVLNQHPELFAAAVPGVGVMDMLRYHRFTVGAAWADEYGSADEADQFANVYGYSPVHGVRVGVDYPPVLVLTADHDDRVHPAHSFKYAATLQAFAMHPPSQKPRLIRIETAGGHGAGKPVAMRISEAADVLAFIGQFTGLKSQP